MDAATVLVVDDDDAVREGLCFLLSITGYRVQGFASGSEFLAAVERFDRACVILDLTMPDMDGAQVLRELRSLGVAHPVIFLTGHGHDEVAALPAHLGISAVLSKPCRDEELLAAIDGALENRA